MFGYFCQLLKPWAIVLIIFGTLLYSTSSFIIIIVWKGYSKIETQYIHKNYRRIFKVLIPNAVGI